MKTPEDEAFDDLAKRQGHWGGGYRAKREAALDKILQEQLRLGVYGSVPQPAQSTFDTHAAPGKALDTHSRLPQPAQEPVAWYHDDFGTLELSRIQRVGWKPLYAAPPQRERVVFPTMLRKMWSGGEVQAWLDENVNKEKNNG